VDLITGAMAISYPLVVWFSLTHWGTRSTALLVLAVAVPVTIAKGLHRKQGMGMLLWQAGGVGVIAMSAFVSGRPAILEQLPVMISLFLLGNFVATLFRPPPMIERYARMVHDDLSPAEVSHCRVTTYVWIGFFALNAVVAEYLALFASTGAWALYSGGIAYGIIGTIAGTEYLVRKARFGRFGKPLPLRIKTIFHTGVIASVFLVGGLFFLIVLFPPLWVMKALFPRIRHPAGVFVEGFYRFLLRALTRSGAIRIVELRGAENLDLGGPAVYVGNHRTLLDVLILLSRVRGASCLMKPLGNKADASLNTNPGYWKAFIKAPLSMAGYITMPHDPSDRRALVETLGRCVRVIKDGRSFIIFPEGTRSTTGRLLPFQDFAFKLAIRAGVPVVPVVFHTQVRFMTKGITIDSPERAMFRITVLPPVPVDDGVTARDLSVETRRRILKVLHEYDREYGYRG